MKIALFSDIHANLPALEAFFDSINEVKPDAIYCLGDLVGYNIWPNEVVNEIRKRKIPTIAGNHEKRVKSIEEINIEAIEPFTTKEVTNPSAELTNGLLGPEERDYLRTLPAHIRVDYQLDGEILSLLMVHGSPRRVDEYLLEDHNEQELLQLMESSDADLMFFGHTHKPYHRILEYENEDRTAYRHAINIGSIGKPKDGDPRGCYVLITINENSSCLKKDSVHVEFIRVAYDIERAAESIESSMLPDKYADMLRKAY